MILDKSNLPPITEYIASNEGFSAKPYKCTAGYLTIGYGRNLDSVGLRKQEIEFFCNKYGLLDEESVWTKLNNGIDGADGRYLLNNDIAQAKDDIKKVVPYFGQLPGFVQYVLIDLTFNVGVNGVKKFKKFISAIGSYHYSGQAVYLNEAAVELLHSKYLLDVKTRAVVNGKLIANDFNVVKKTITNRPGTSDHVATIDKYGR